MKMRISKTNALIAMAKKGMTQKDVAESIGMTQQYLCIVLGRGTCSMKTLEKIAKAIGVDVMDIVKEEEQ